MNKNLRWKLLLCIGVLLLFGIVGVYPIVASIYKLPSPQAIMDKQLKLGLDLKGGVHLVLRVKTDTALRVETELEMQRVAEAARNAGISIGAATATSEKQFKIEGVPSAQDAAFRQALASTSVEANFDRSPGAGGTYTFTLKPNIERQLREESVVQAQQTIERRVNELGVAEPSIARQGQAGDQILVELPGLDDVNRAKSIIGSPGQLQLKLVEQGPFPTQEAALQAYNNALPPDLMIVPGTSDPANAGAAPGSTIYYVLRRVAPITGRDLRSARQSLDQNNQPAVSFTLSNDGAKRFGALTETNIGRNLAIVLDNKVFSAPRIDGRITDNGQIFGSFTTQEANDLALVLRSGALPAELDYLEEQTIGPSLGADAIKSGVIASVVGLVLIITFMLIYYKLSGVNAVIALLFNLVILLGLMAYIGAVMTLPGIAGFVLTMGIGVDSNVLIFERIKEELEAGRPVRAAVNAGFSRVFLTLLDTHISAVIGALFLFQFGNGPIRGFAMTLFIGLASNLFTSTFVSKTLFELALGKRQQAATLSI
jgi:preprotein translocase subunit SecD